MMIFHNAQSAKMALFCTKTNAGKNAQSDTLMFQESAKSVMVNVMTAKKPKTNAHHARKD